MSWLESNTTVSENSSPGIPGTASGLPASVLGLTAASAPRSGCAPRVRQGLGVELEDVTFGSGVRNVGVNETRAPLSSVIGPPPAPADQRRERAAIRPASDSGASPGRAASSTSSRSIDAFARRERERRERGARRRAARAAAPASARLPGTRIARRSTVALMRRLQPPRGRRRPASRARAARRRAGGASRSACPRSARGTPARAELF